MLIYVGRPAFGQENNQVGIFKLIGGGSEAVRTPVKLGKSSVNTIEIQGGPAARRPGDSIRYQRLGLPRTNSTELTVNHQHNP